ncbi:MAG: acyltransferase domain-containing protein [bacterium]|nr:acyltransferase domain-containing protein [bacterium]
MSDTENNTEETGLEIAVIGMAGRFPGAKDIHEFWENLKNGVEAITFFSRDQLIDAGEVPEKIDNPNFVGARGVLDNVEYFDAAFFGFTPVEAELMSPQVRMFMECSWHALEDAGYNPNTYEGDIGVYAGHSSNHYWIAKSMFSNKSALLGSFKTGLLTTHFSTIVSYHLNLTGPALSIQTACSTSLVTIHSACLSLLSSECDMALAGGASLALPQVSGYLFKEGLVSSPDGHCRAFDARGKGTIGGSGVGVVVLKRLEDALDDNDHIYALVKGIAINNDGLRKVGYTAPSVDGQAGAIRSAYRLAAVEPGAVSYIETHGTGTPLGDPVEIEALNMVFSGLKKASIPIGAVKTNVGHLDTAAGVTGFIKTVLALKYKLLPPTLHFQTPNPKIGFENTPFYVNTQLVEWGGDHRPLRAGVSSFGIGGTNAHAVLEEAPLRPSKSTHSRKYKLLLLSAESVPALQRMSENLSAFLNPVTPGGGPVTPGGIEPVTPEGPGNFTDIAYTLQVGRKHFTYRNALVASSALEAAEMPVSFPKKVKKNRWDKEEPPVVFLLSGQGSQYVGMGWDLYRTEPYFREETDRCFELVRSLSGIDIKKILYPEDNPVPTAPVAPVAGAGLEAALVDRTGVTQPLTFIFSYVLGKLLMRWGVNPRAMMGYSMGEYIAACLAGVFSLEDALKLVTARGQLMAETPIASMLSVPVSLEALNPLLKDHDNIRVAIINGPSCVVTGPTDAVAAFEKEMRAKRLVCAAVNMAHAVHSPMMEPIRESFENKIKELELNAPQIPYISNLSGQWITAEDATDPAYWGKHLCNTVRFSDGIGELLKEENAVFIEVGPGRLLSNIVRFHSQLLPDGKNRHKIVNVVRHQQQQVDDDYYLLNKIGELWLYGVPIDWSGYYADEDELPFRVPLPGYSFEKIRYWIDGDPFQNILRSQRDSLPGTSVEQTPAPTSTPISSAPNNRFGDEYGYSGATGLDEGAYVGPRDELEESIAALWQEFLGFDRIGINDSYFDINGDSLTATQLVTRLLDIYPVEISLEQFFAEPTIAGLAGVVRELLIAKVKDLSEEELEKLAETMDA